MCVSPPPTPSVMWYDMYPHDKINKFYNIYMAVVVAIISRHGLAIEEHQPNKSKLALYKLLLSHYKSHLKQLHICNKMECFSYKGGYGICVLRAFEPYKRAGLSYR